MMKVFLPFVLIWSLVPQAYAAGLPPALREELQFLQIEYAGPFFDLRKSEDLQALSERLALLKRMAVDQMEIRKTQKALLKGASPLECLSSEAIRAYFQDPPSFLGKKSLRGLKWMHEKVLQRLDGDSQWTDVELLELQQVARATRNNAKPIAPDRMELTLSPFLYLDYFHNPMAQGRERPWNVETPRGDPEPGFFWNPPPEIASQDLYSGFGRDSHPEYQEVIWEYDEPKTSRGSNPGFELKSGKWEIKAKFGEVISEPFAARIFHALGYNVDPTDYVSGLRVHYSRRIFREFHQREDHRIHFTFLRVIPTLTVALQKQFDPFAFIQCAKLKDGTLLEAEEFRRRLLKNQRFGAWEEPGNFNEAFEAQVDWVLTSPVNVQPKKKNRPPSAPGSLEAWATKGDGNCEARASLQHGSAGLTPGSKTPASGWMNRIRPSS